MNEATTRIFAIYLHLFRRHQFLWRSAHGILNRELTEAETRECIDDVCDRLRMMIGMNGAPLSQDEHNFLKTELTKKVMGPTKKTW